MTSIRPFVVFAALAVLLAAAPGQAQTATSVATIVGAVLSEQGNPMTGATLTALHLPTGTRRVVTSDMAGQFSLSPMLTGGPYVL